MRAVIKCLIMAIALGCANASAEGMRLFDVPEPGLPVGGIPLNNFRFSGSVSLPIPPRSLLGADPSQQCRVAIAMAEHSHALPPGLLEAIGQVETGRRGPDGRVAPWPWSINAEGTDHVYQTKAEVIAAVRTLQQGGMRSIDVGCLQVNLMHHPNAFASLEDAFDPVRNAQYAADFLVQLRQQTGSWTAATADYHSATPELGGPYAAKVNATWAAEGGHPDLSAGAGVLPGGQAFGMGLAGPLAAFGVNRGGMIRPASPYSASLTMPRTPTAGLQHGLAAVPGGGFGLGGLAGGGRSLAAYRLLPVRVASGQPLH